MRTSWPPGWWRLGLGEAVAFEPPQAIRSVLARGRIMVVPSLAESLPYVVLEAAAACQPLVATNVGGHPGDLRSRRLPARPAPDGKALADAITRILDADPEVIRLRFQGLAGSVKARFR